MSGFLSSPSFGSVTQKDVMAVMKQIQLLLCRYHIHKERSSIFTCLDSKVAGASYRKTLSPVFISPINGRHLMLQPILPAITISRVPMLCISDGSWTCFSNFPWVNTAEADKSNYNYLVLLGDFEGWFPKEISTITLEVSTPEYVVKFHLNLTDS